MNESELKQIIREELLKEGTWAVPMNKSIGKVIIDKVKRIKNQIYDIFGDDQVMNGFDAAIMRMEELNKDLNENIHNTPQMGDILTSKGTAGYDPDASNQQYNEWNGLTQLKDSESFTRDELKLILMKIYDNVYMEDKQRMLELLRFFNLADDFV